MNPMVLNRGGFLSFLAQEERTSRQSMYSENGPFDTL